MMFTRLRWRESRSGSLPALLSALNLRGKLLVDFKTISILPHGAHHTRRRYCSVGKLLGRPASMHILGDDLFDLPAGSAHQFD
jgi:hypothetical protein